jgi:hypothetical protein
MAKRLRIRPWLIFGILVLVVIWGWLSWWAYYRIQRIICAVHMIGIREGFYAYTNDYKDKFPTGEKWCDLLIEEAVQPKGDFQCPCDSVGPCSYAINSAVYRYAAWGNVPRDMVLVFESEPGWNRVGGRMDLTTRYHRGRGCMILFANDIVTFVPSDELSKLRWE